MSYGYSGRSRYQYNFQPSPWESGRAPDRGMTATSSLDQASQIAAANAILNAVSVLQGKDDRGVKRRFDSIDSYGYDRRQTSYSTYRRGTQRYSGSNRGRGSWTSRPRGGRAQKTEDKEKSSIKKVKTEKVKKEEGEDEDEEDEGAEVKEEKKEEKYSQDWKFRCHLCRKSYETEEEHLEHLKTEDHVKTMTEQKSRYKRQMQAIVFKLRDLEDEGERRGDYRHGFCTICNVGFYGAAARHNQNRLHKDMRNLKAAFCRYCNLRFVDRIKFDEHILTIRHMKRRTKVMTEGEGAVEKDKGEDEDDDEDGEDLYFPAIYNEEVLGKQCVNKIFGFFCKICSEFFHGSQSDREKHCKTEAHFDKFVEYAKVRKEEIEQKKEILKQQEEEKAAKGKENGEAEEGEEDINEEGEEDVLEEGEEGQLVVISSYGSVGEVGEDEEAEIGEDEDLVLVDEEEVKSEEEPEEVEDEQEPEKVEEEKEPEIVSLKPKGGRGRGRGRGKRTSK